MLLNTVKSLLFAGTILLPLSLQAAELKITFKEVKNTDGALMVALYDNAKGFLGESSVKDVQANAETGEVIVVIEAVEPGEYAIACYHDENANGELDTNFFGVPKEGLGISNDAPANFGPPSFKDAAFTVDAEDLMLEITMRY